MYIRIVGVVEHSLHAGAHAPERDLKRAWGAWVCRFGPRARAAFKSLREASVAPDLPGALRGGELRGLSAGVGVDPKRLRWPARR